MAQRASALGRSGRRRGLALVQYKVTKSHEWQPQDHPTNGDPRPWVVHVGALTPQITTRTDAASRCQKGTFAVSAPTGLARKGRPPCCATAHKPASPTHEWLPLQHPMSGDLSPRHQPEAQARHRLPLAGLRLHRQASTHSVDVRPRILKVGDICMENKCRPIYGN